MNIFLDTDVLIDLAIDRKPFSTHATSLIDFIQAKQVKTFVAWHTISNFYYLVSAEKNKKMAMDFIRDLLGFVKIPRISNEEVLLATKLDMTDFEDAMQVSAALAARADMIITRNLKDFVKSPIPVFSPKDFLEKYG